MGNPAVPADNLLAPGVGYYYIVSFGDTDGVCNLSDGMKLDTKVNIVCVNDELVFVDKKRIPANIATKCSEVPADKIAKSTVFQLFNTAGNEALPNLCICYSGTCSAVRAMDHLVKLPSAGQRDGSGSAKWAVVDDSLGGLLHYTCDDKVDVIGDHNYMNAYCTGTDGVTFAKNEYVCKTKPAKSQQAFKDEEAVGNLGTPTSVSCAFTNCAAIKNKQSCKGGIDIFDENVKYITTCNGDGSAECAEIATTGTPSSASGMIVTGVFSVMAAVALI